MDYYEIDPSDGRGIARDSGHVHLSQGMPAGRAIILGDARLTLADAPDGSYDLIVVDAFSSDAIPIHLLTKEAMAIYMEKLVAARDGADPHLQPASRARLGRRRHRGGQRHGHAVSESADVNENDDEYKFLGTVDRQRARRTRISARSPSRPYWELQTA